MIDLTAPIEKYGVTPDITHMDLYYPGTVSSPASLITDCVLIDLTDEAENVDLEAIPALDLVEKGNAVILKTGWEQYRGMPEYAHCPWVDKKLIQWLVEKGVVLILIDSPGVYGGKRGQEHNHMDQYLADHQAYAVENLVNVGRINETKFKLFCFPIHMTAQNNAPCRVVADLAE
jgi:kynurenine formamidase